MVLEVRDTRNISGLMFIVELAYSLQNGDDCPWPRVKCGCASSLVLILGG